MTRSKREAAWSIASLLCSILAMIVAIQTLCYVRSVDDHAKDVMTSIIKADLKQPKPYNLTITWIGLDASVMPRAPFNMRGYRSLAECESTARSVLSLKDDRHYRLIAACTQ